jgi:hypothetical protein
LELFGRLVSTSVSLHTVEMGWWGSGNLPCPQRVVGGTMCSVTLDTSSGTCIMPLPRPHKLVAARPHSWFVPRLPELQGGQPSSANDIPTPELPDLNFSSLPGSWCPTCRDSVAVSQKQAAGNCPRRVFLS